MEIKWQFPKRAQTLAYHELGKVSCSL